MLKILVASDHALLREGIRKLLDTDRILFVVGEASDTRTALELIDHHAPDILLLDWSLPRGTSVGFLRHLASRPARRGVRVVVLSESVDSCDVQVVLELGARGLVFKDAGAAVLIKAIHAVAAGQYWVARESLANLVQLLRHTAAGARTGQEPARPFGLTPREFQIMCAVAAARANKDIAAQFSISEKTVKHHLTNIFEKVGVSNRLELALVAFEDRREPSAPPGPRRAAR
jgi:DNA-binding NarL/FixJ family response regulator